MNYKNNAIKIIASLGFIIVGITFYSIIFLSSNQASLVNFLFAFIVFIIPHLIFSIFYSKTDYQKRYLFFIGILFIIAIVIKVNKFNVCDEKADPKYQTKACDCIGLKKSGSLLPNYFWKNECVGYRKKCYKFDNIPILQKINNKEILITNPNPPKIEINCN